MAASDTLHERIGQDLVSVAAQLQLKGQYVGKQGLQAFLQTIPDETGLQYPCVLASYEEDTEEEGDSAFEVDVWGYPVQMAIVDTQSVIDPRARQDYLAFRRLLMRRIRGLMSLPQCPEVWDVRVRGRRIFNPDLPKHTHLVSGFTVVAWTSEPRQFDPLPGLVSQEGS